MEATLRAGKLDEEEGRRVCIGRGLEAARASGEEPFDGRGHWGRGRGFLGDAWCSPQELPEVRANQPCLAL